MPLPGQTLTQTDGALALDTGDTDYSVAIGMCSSGTPLATYVIGDPAAISGSLGVGPLAEAVAFKLAAALKPVVAIPCAVAAAGTMGAFTNTGTSPAASDSGSAPNDAYQLRIKYTLAGVRGTARFVYSLDGGDSWSSPVLTAATVTLPGTGITVAFASGSYVVGDTASADATAPAFDSTGLAAALAVALADSRRFRLIHVVGTTSTPAALATIVASIETQVAAATATGRFCRVVVEAPTVNLITSVTPTGTNPPTVTLSGNPVAGTDQYRIEITTLGARGTAVFRWSSDGGTTWTSSVTTAATVQLGSTGVTATFATGTNYAVDNVYTASAIASDDAIVTAFAATSAKHVVLATRACELTSALALGRTYKRSTAWPAVARILSRPIHEHPGWYAQGPLDGVAALYGDERLATTSLDGARCLTLRTFVDGGATATGFFVTNGYTLAPVGSDFAEIQDCMVLDRASEVAWSEMLAYVNADLLLKADYTLDEVQARNIEEKARARLRKAIVKAGHASAIDFTVSRIEPTGTSHKLKYKVRVLKRGVSKSVDGEIGFAPPSVAA